MAVVAQHLFFTAASNGTSLINNSRWWGSWFWNSTIKKVGKQRRTVSADWIATSSLALLKVYQPPRSAPATLLAQRCQGSHLHVHGWRSSLLKAVKLLFGLSDCIQHSVIVELASVSRAHTGSTELSGWGAPWLQTLSGWDASTPGGVMSHGSSTDWRTLSSYVGGGWRQKRDRFKVCQHVCTVHCDLFGPSKLLCHQLTASWFGRFLRLLVLLNH